MSRRSGKSIHKNRKEDRQSASHEHQNIMDEQEREALFQALAEEPLKQWDHSIAPDVPSLESISQLISSHKEVVRSRLWRDLLLLWGIGSFIITGLMFVLYSSFQVFLFVQLGTLGAAGLILLRASFRKEGRRKWTH